MVSLLVFTVLIVLIPRFLHPVVLQIFDAIIIVSSFIIDVVFLGEVMGEEGSKAAAVLVVLLLWRIARVVDGKCEPHRPHLLSFVARSKCIYCM